MLYFVLSVILFVCPVFASGGNWIQEDSAIKIVDCTEKITVNETGRIFLEFEQNCEGYYDIYLHLKSQTSIFSLIATFQYLRNTTNPKPTESVIGTEKSILDAEDVDFDVEKREAEVKIYEQTIYQEGKADILFANWNFPEVNENSTWNSKKYLSRTSTAKIQVAINGDWTDYRIVFFYKEIKYDEIVLDYSEFPGEIKSPNTYDGQYRPNTVVLYRLNEALSSNWNSILITIEQVDIDTAMGEYLLIGAGTQPFKGSKPLFISQPQSNSTYYVDDSSAYILFVSSSTQTTRSGFTIRWDTGTRTPVEDDSTENPLDDLKSREICFYNVPSEECNKTRYENKDGLFNRFRGEFIEVAKDYATNYIYTENFKRLNASSVVLYGTENCFDRSPLQAIIQVKHQGRSLLTWKQLGAVIDNFIAKNSDHSVGHCPKSFVYDSKAWSYLIYLSVPAFALLFLILWAWKQKVFEQSCKPEKEGSVRQPTEQNFYEETSPKIVETNVEGRRRTLVVQHSAPGNVEGHRSNEGNIMEMADIPTTSQESDSTRRLSFPWSATLAVPRRPSLQSLLDGNEKKNKESSIIQIKTQESEHLYDSVSSNHTVIDTKL